jgi:hypothetical protein
MQIFRLANQIVNTEHNTRIIDRIPILLLLAKIAIIVLAKAHRNTIDFGDEMSNKAEFAIPVTDFTDPVVGAFKPLNNVWHKEPFFKKAYVRIQKRAQHKLSLIILTHELLMKLLITGIVCFGKLKLGCRKMEFSAVV